MGWGFVNVNLRPYYAEGSKSMGFEIAEDLGWRAPDHVVAPMAGGSLIGKIHKAFHEFERLGLLEGPVRTRMFGAQATGCNPISATVKTGASKVKPIRHPDTIAKSLAIGDPADGYFASKLIRETGGWSEDVDDEAIVDAMTLLAETEGIWAETAGGVTLAVAIQADRARQDRPRRLHGALHHRQRPENPGGSRRPARPAGGHRAHPRSLREPGRIARPWPRSALPRSWSAAACERPAGPRGFLVQGPKPVSMENDTMAIVRIPTPLRPHAGGQDRVETAGATVGEILANLGTAFPTLRERLFDGEELRRFVNVYLNNEDIRYLDDLATPVAENDEVSIIPAVAGG